jgi:MFS family permease
VPTSGNVLTEVVPSNLFLNKLGYPAVYLSVFMMLWGALSCVTGAVTSYSGLLVCRFFLGFLEAAYFPGVAFLLSCWYTRKEVALRSAMLFSGL